MNHAELFHFPRSKLIKIGVPAVCVDAVPHTLHFVFFTERVTDVNPTQPLITFHVHHRESTRKPARFILLNYRSPLSLACSEFPGF